MENNVFYQNRMEIKKLAEERHAEIYVATRMFGMEHHLENCQEQLAAWDTLCRDYMQSNEKTLADLFR